VISYTMTPLYKLVLHLHTDGHFKERFVKYIQITHNHAPLRDRCKYKTLDTPQNGTPYTHTIKQYTSQVGTVRYCCVQTLPYMQRL